MDNLMLEQMNLLRRRGRPETNNEGQGLGMVKGVKIGGGHVVAKGGCGGIGGPAASEEAPAEGVQ